MLLLLPLAPSRSRLSYPYLEVAGRAWLASPSEAASTMTASTLTASTPPSSASCMGLARWSRRRPATRALSAPQLCPPQLCPPQLCPPPRLASSSCSPLGPGRTRAHQGAPGRTRAHQGAPAHAPEHRQGCPCQGCPCQGCPAHHRGLGAAARLSCTAQESALQARGVPLANQ